MTRSTLKVGLRHKHWLTVDPILTVPHLPPPLDGFAKMPAVLATAYLVALVESACVAALAPHLEESERTVGTRIDLSHSAPTPPGMAVTVEVELLAINERRLRFGVECRDERELIGEGFHERVIVNARRFSERVERKLIDDS